MVVYRHPWTFWRNSVACSSGDGTDWLERGASSSGSRDDDDDDDDNGVCPRGSLLPWLTACWGGARRLGLSFCGPGRVGARRGSCWCPLGWLPLPFSPGLGGFLFYRLVFCPTREWVRAAAAATRWEEVNQVGSCGLDPGREDVDGPGADG